MSEFGYRRELSKYEDIDEDEILASLTSDELKELERELDNIDPNEFIPIGLRQKDQTDKTPQGTFSREALMAYWEHETQKLLENERLCAEPNQFQTQASEASKGNTENDNEDESEDDDIDIEECTSETTSEEDEIVTEGEEEEDEEEEGNESTPEIFDKRLINSDGQRCNGHIDNQSTINGFSKEKVIEDDPNLKVVANRNTTVVEDALESIKNNDAEKTEINLNNIENISTATFKLIAEALKQNTVVKLLSLANTHADDQAACALADMLQVNRTITNLNIDSNYITGKGILAIIRAIQHNGILTELRFHNQRHICGGQVEMEIANLLKENATLMKLGYHFDLPGPRMTMTSILTRNLDKQRQKRLQEQKEQQEMDKLLGFEGPTNPRKSALQKDSPRSSPRSSPRNSPWSSPKVVPKKVHCQKSAIPPPPPPPPLPDKLVLPVPPPPPPLPVQPTPSRNIAEAIKLQELKLKNSCQNNKVKKSKSIKKKQHKENNILKELKNSLKPISDQRSEDGSRPATPHTTLHDELMSAIRASSIKQLRRVEVPEYLR
ncbi:leiomodin-2-like [Mobula hypostoma]|uniref:leiomodin-2-like n=1 Tax=Mobula hypostoma TaxID=723540 RepID=UPI002FC2BE0D